MDSSSLPISTGDFRGLVAPSSRSSPRSRRDNNSNSLLPTVVFDPHSPRLRPSLFFRTLKSRKDRGAFWWINGESTRRLLPWVALILIWFYVGFRLHIQWSGDSPALIDSVSTDAIVTDESTRESEQALEMPKDDLAEEDMATIGKDNGILEEGELKEGETGSSNHKGRIVGPFDVLERQVLGRNDKGRMSCWKQGRFAEFVRAKSFVLVFHELSMTGAPLALLELASKIVSCGGKASAVVLNKRGGLYDELVERGIVVVRDKLASSWKAAARADLVVASSAACNSWIEQYLRHNRKGGERLIWWMMENRREYFDRSKLLLGKVRALLFLSETQEQLWRQWATEDALTLPSMIKVVSLSVSEDLAASAGLNDEAISVNSFLEAQKKRDRLRDLVRKEMGLAPSDYLVIFLSSINPGKGQLRMLQAALILAQGGVKIQSRKGESTRNLRLLLGSLGSKSNKPEYLEKIHELLDMHPKLAKMVLWTEATVHVGPLYAAADAYVMNAQGIGETFGRVTVEAMAFGLPVLGTDAGGTKEILQGNITGLLHPAGQAGIPSLAHNLQWLLSHAEIGVEMGKKGRARVQDKYREAAMYEAMATVFLDAVHG